MSICFYIFYDLAKSSSVLFFNNHNFEHKCAMTHVQASTPIPLAY